MGCPYRVREELADDNTWWIVHGDWRHGDHSINNLKRGDKIMDAALTPTKLGCTPSALMVRIHDEEGVVPTKKTKRIATAKLYQARKKAAMLSLGYISNVPGCALGTWGAMENAIKESKAYAPLLPSSLDSQKVPSSCSSHRTTR